MLVPIPEEEELERLITIVFASFNFFCLVTTFDFKTVANKLAFPATLLNPTNVTVFLSAAISTWLSLSGSTEPSL